MDKISFKAMQCIAIISMMMKSISGLGLQAPNEIDPDCNCKNIEGIYEGKYDPYKLIKETEQSCYLVSGCVTYALEAIAKTPGGKCQAKIYECTDWSDPGYPNPVIETMVDQANCEESSYVLEWPAGKTSQDPDLLLTSSDTYGITNGHGQGLKLQIPSPNNCNCQFFQGRHEWDDGTYWYVTESPRDGSTCLEFDESGGGQGWEYRNFHVNDAGDKCVFQYYWVDKDQCIYYDNWGWYWTEYAKGEFDLITGDWDESDQYATEITFKNDDGSYYGSFTRVDFV